MTYGVASRANPLEDLLGEIEVAARSGLVRVCLNSALIVPDVCADLEGKPQGRQRYVDWFEENMPTKYHERFVHRARLKDEWEGRFVHPRPADPALMSGSDAYFLRCKMLHEFESFHHLGHSHKIRFVPGDMLMVAETGAGGNELYLNPIAFSLDFVAAARAWLARNASNPVVLANMHIRFALYPDGIGGTRGLPVMT